MKYENILFIHSSVMLASSVGILHAVLRLRLSRLFLSVELQLLTEVEEVYHSHPSLVST